MEVKNSHQEQLKESLHKGPNLFTALKNTQAKCAEIEAAAELIFENWVIFLNTERGKEIVKKIKDLRPAKKKGPKAVNIGPIRTAREASEALKRFFAETEQRERSTRKRLDLALRRVAQAFDEMTHEAFEKPKTKFKRKSK